MSARTDLRGGYQATGIPTATSLKSTVEIRREQIPGLE
jgi:hypothetical protein